MTVVIFVGLGIFALVMLILTSVIIRWADDLWDEANAHDRYFEKDTRRNGQEKPPRAARPQG